MSSDDPASTMRRDIASAYAVTLARVASWVIVSAVVFRQMGAEALGVLTLVRATVGVLAYTSLGLGPALVKMLSDAAGPAPGPDRAAPIAALAVESPEQAKPLLAYAQRPPKPEAAVEIKRIYATGEFLALWLGIGGVLLAGLYGAWFASLHGVEGRLKDTAGGLVMLMGAGMVFRLISDAPSGLLQARGKIALDNALLALAEIAWGAWTAAVVWNARPHDLILVGGTFMAVNLGLLLARGVIGRWLVRSLTMARAPLSWDVARRLLSLGGLIVLAQVADFLYAPTDCILIAQLMDPEHVAYYSPAIQIDAGLLLLVGGLATVLYPKSSIAHAAGDVDRIRRYYLIGTLASAGILLAAALLTWALSRWIFVLWFGHAMPQTQAILPLLLVHTVIGGSSAVGRSVLLAVGKAGPFTAAVLIAGVSNIVLSYAFVKYGGLGLAGIVLGTVIVVTARCALWMPWYITRTLRLLQAGPATNQATLDP